MNPAYAQTLRELLRTQQVAALGTLHQGQPYVSMVPFALLPGGSGFVIHVSQLAAHTKDMLLSPQVSLLVVAPPTPDVPAQALARITVQGRAAQVRRRNRRPCRGEGRLPVAVSPERGLVQLCRLLAVRDMAGLDPLRRRVCPGHDDFAGNAR